MKVCTYVNRQDTYRQIWGVGWGQSTISSMFLNRDPEFTGDTSQTTCLAIYEVKWFL